MAAFRPSSAWLKGSSITGPTSKLRKQAIKQHLAAHGKKLERSSKVPVIPKCPAPTCECADMPPDLDIERSKDLNGTMAAYSQQILVSTGQLDWKSKIEDEKDTAPWGSAVAQIKELLGPKGRFHDPYRNVVVSTSSFESPQGSNQPQVLLYPSFTAVDGVEATTIGIAQFLETFVLPNPSRDTNRNAAHPQRRTFEEKDWSGMTRPISTPTVLVCSHHSRDSRCGVLGPLLHAEFVQYINKRHTLRNQVTADVVTHESHSNEAVHSFASHPTFRPDAIDTQHQDQHPVNVGMISHIGGHKWAGNVIIYIPPDYRLKALERSRRGAKPRDKVVAGAQEQVVHEDEPLSPEEEQAGISPLAGKGIWYGRVEPKHVEGIIEQTIGHGQIIRELFRGGVNKNGSPIMID